jgi:hypothetical protein
MARADKKFPYFVISGPENSQQFDSLTGLCGIALSFTARQRAAAATAAAAAATINVHIGK